MLMHEIAHRGCTDTVRESALNVSLWEKYTLLHWGLAPESVLYLAFQSDTLPTELLLALDCTTELHVNVFVTSCAYSTVTLTLARE